ncbi:MAG TPA: folylpolyglutamate synthase/dihydrofolate synthase family protein [Vicinamibacterales bacterium]|nr:folylpolyglutamate synthase/dihydrofolate synthase family protein [Vicinamibacterales bacterium]
MQDPLTWLFALEQFGIKFGLDNISTLVARLGHPERAFSVVHIAGTNGKGSVTAMVDASLRAAGHRSARYTSPHLVDLSERFVVDGHPVTDEALAAAVNDVRTAIDGLRRDGGLDVQPTFFEVATATAFELFRRAGVEVAVLEVGLGGRLDATNVVAPPALLATAITSIDFDHQLYLGTTLREIAIEKAGIIKAGVPVVVGPMAPSAAAAISEVAGRRGATVIRATPADVDGMTLGLAGEHQRGNAAVAMHVLQLLDARGVAVPGGAITAGFADPQWPGRLEVRRLPDGRELLLDAAHNPAGAVSLASYLRAQGGDPRPLVLAAMRDKDAAGIFTALLPAVGCLIVTRASNARSADPAVLAQQARAIAPALPIAIEPALDAALDAAWRSSPRIVVAGSIFLLGDVMKRAGGS